MKALVVVLAALLLAPDALGSGAAWQRKRVVVYDHTPSDWQATLSNAIARFNAMRPPRVPRLIYRRMDERRCKAARHKGGIGVCVAPAMRFPGDTAVVWERGEMLEARIRLQPFIEFEDPLVIACHELFHAVTGAPEGAWASVRPCPYGPEYAERVYRKHERRPHPATPVAKSP